MAGYNSHRASGADDLISKLKELDEKTPLVRMAIGGAAGYLAYKLFFD